jgi:hypothetical protein
MINVSPHTAQRMEINVVDLAYAVERVRREAAEKKGTAQFCSECGQRLSLQSVRFLRPS